LKKNLAHAGRVGWVCWSIFSDIYPKWILKLWASETATIGLGPDVAKTGGRVIFLEVPVSRIPVADRNLVLPRVEDLEIVVMLFDRVADSLQTAIDHCRAGDIEARCHALTAAAEAIGDLAEGIEPGSADEWSTRTASLYADILRRIVVANTRNDADQIGHALRLVTPVHLSWRTLLARAEQSRLTEESAPRLAVA